MPQHPCPCPNFGVDNGNAYAIGTGDAPTVADAVVAAEAAELANATTQADNLAQGHTCAAGCVLVGKLTWHLAQRAWLLIGARPNGAGGIVFRVLSFGRFMRRFGASRYRCRSRRHSAVASAGRSLGRPDPRRRRGSLGRQPSPGGSQRVSRVIA
jgi:hypothetical protein